MSWASRMRFLYTLGVLLFFAIVLGIPAIIWWYESPTCFDQKLNQGETAIDKGGPCILVDERTLSPYSVLWSRAFSVRSGSYNAVAYIENPNGEAGARAVSYRFRLYDDRNIVVAEREGTTFLKPGGITPIFEGGIPTGNREVSRTFFEFADMLVWERLFDVASVVSISNKLVSDADTAPRVTAQAKNNSVDVILNPAFVAVLFDTAGNAFAASHTTLPRLAGGEEGKIVFAWSAPFPKVVGRIDILVLVPPAVPRK